MIRASISPFFITYNISKSYKLNAFRTIRNIAKQGTGPKLLEGKVKTVTKYDNTPQIQSYQDLVDNIKKSDLGDELEVEKAFAQDDDFSHALERSNQYCDIHLREEREMKSKVKKMIIKKKYFKFDKETNLLTYAAKEQIHFLHKSNPQEWTPKALAECFPITETGIEKLLKSHFIQTDPEKIKSHDRKVAERWKMLKSGKFTTSVSSLTQQFYKEGKLVDDYFSGNPNLPTTPPTKKVVQIEKKKSIGEFSQIVQTYSDYTKQKLLKSGTENLSENQVIVRENDNVKFRRSENQDIKNFKHASEEFDDETAEILSKHKKHKIANTDLPLSQFKEILKEEIRSKQRNESEYNEVLSEKYTPKLDTDLSKIPDENPKIFSKISKYDQHINISAMYDRNKNLKTVYKYDDKLGYQHPIGKYIKGNVRLPPKLHKEGKLFKVGQCVYDEDGEFLYKVPA